MELYCPYIVEVGSKETIHCNLYISMPLFTVFCEEDTEWIYLLIYLFIYLFAIGFETSQSQCTQALTDGSFVPHINLWEHCCFAEVPDGPQTYTV
jgi:hypothetical protein